MKKVFLIVILSILLLGVVACDETPPTPPVSEQVTLPSLSGKNKSDVINELSGLQITYTFNDVTAFNVTEGNFVSYGDGLKAGNKVDKNTHISVFFSIHKNILPNLTGLTRQQVILELQKLQVSIDVRYIDSDTIEQGVFSHYGSNKQPGHEIPIDGEVIVFIAQAPTTFQKVLISKYLEGTGNNRAIEIFNGKDVEIDLSNYVIDIYSDGSTTHTSSIQLTGMLQPNEVYILSHSGANTEVLALADQTSENLIFDGNDVIVLAYSDHRKIDVLGTLGWALYNLDNRVYSRKTDVVYATESFTLSQWGIYAPDYSEIFGSHPVDYPTTFTYNPEHVSLDYYTNNMGMIKVTFDYNHDGDTARFLEFNDDVDAPSVRFIGIDTREMGDEDLAAFAQDFVEGILTSASEIYVQRDPTAGLKETYGRYLGLIWADGVLVNYELVKYGYSQNNYSDPNHTLIYNGISLHQWFQNAEQYAKDHKLGIWA